MPLPFADAFPNVPPEDRQAAEVRLRRYLEIVVTLTDREREQTVRRGPKDLDEVPVPEPADSVPLNLPVEPCSPADPLTNSRAPRTLAYSDRETRDTARTLKDVG